MRVVAVLSDMLESIPQRELNQARRAHRAVDFSECRRVLNIIQRRTSKINVIPDIEEVRGETQILPLSDAEVLDQRKVPVLLEWSAIQVPAKIPKGRDSRTWVRRRCRNKVVDIQVSIEG